MARLFNKIFYSCTFAYGNGPDCNYAICFQTSLPAPNLGKVKASNRTDDPRATVKTETWPLVVRDGTTDLNVQTDPADKPLNLGNFPGLATHFDRYMYHLV